IFFRADSFGRAGQVITQLFTAWGRPSPLVTSSVVLAILVGIGSQYLPRRGIAALLQGFQRLPAVGQVATLALALLLAATLAAPLEPPAKPRASKVAVTHRPKRKPKKPAVLGHFTRSHPLRAWVAGDSLAQVPGQALERAVGAAGPVEVLGVESRLDTGLT